MSILHPYIPTTWHDGSGTSERHRTLTIADAGILNAVLGVVISLTISRLAYFANALLDISFLYQHPSSILNDQVNEVAKNEATSPGDFLFSILCFILAVRRKIVLRRIFSIFNRNSTHRDTNISDLRGWKSRYVGTGAHLEGGCRYLVHYRNATSSTQVIPHAGSTSLSQRRNGRLLRNSIIRTSYKSGCRLY